jgi:hypothetical protein
MLLLDGINYWAIIVVWLIYMALGAYWYSPAGFAKQWTKYTGINIMKIPQEKATKILGYIVLSCLVQVIALSIVINSLNASTIVEALSIGILLWLGFTAATTVGVTLYSERSWKFLWLNSSYFLVVMSLGSIILTIW